MILDGLGFEYNYIVLHKIKWGPWVSHLNPLIMWVGVGWTIYCFYSTNINPNPFSMGGHGLSIGSPPILPGLTLSFQIVDSVFYCLVEGGLLFDASSY